MTQLPRQRMVWLMAGLMTAMFLSALNQTILTTALPTIVGELHGAHLLTFVVTAYFLTSTVMMPVYGSVSDLFGRRPLLVIAISVFIAGSLLGALAQDIHTMILARAVQGAGGGGIILLSQAAVGDVVPARRRAEYFGWMATVFAASSLAGPFIGGWLTEGPGWRWAFWMNLPVGALALIAVLVVLRPPARPAAKRRVDVVGIVLLSTFTTALILVATMGGVIFPWLSWQTGALAAVAVVAAVLTWRVEDRTPGAIFPPALFRRRNFAIATGTGLVSGIAMFGVAGYMPTYLQIVRGATATEAGAQMAALMGTLVVTSTVAGSIISRTGRYKGLFLVGACTTVIGLALLGILRPDTPVIFVCIVLGVIGIGIGLGMQLTLIAQITVPASQLGTATSSYQYVRHIGSTLGTAVVGSVFVGRLLPQLSGVDGLDAVAAITPEAVDALPSASQAIVEAAYQWALIPVLTWLAPVAAIGIVLLAFLRPQRLDDGAREHAEA